MSHKDDVFLKVFIGVLLGLAVFTIAIIILANSVGVLEQESISPKYGGQSTLEQRIAPVGMVRVVGQVEVPVAAAAAAPVARSGQEIVQSACAACHSTGAAGAPKTGVAADWTGRIEKGMAVLLDHAINGYKGMPARGGNPTLSDEDMKKAVVHMLEQLGASTTGAAKAEPAAIQSAAAASPGAGKQDYTTACAACHDTGVAGAPKVGDTGAWSSRIARGMDSLNQHAVQGFRAMPPKGGRLDLSDAAVVAAVAYMVENSD